MTDNTLRDMMQEKGITVQLLAYVMDVSSSAIRYALKHPRPIWFQHIREALEIMESCKNRACPK